MNRERKEKKIRVGMISLGCPKTLVDSEIILGKLDPSRYEVLRGTGTCDIAILNTCTFIHDAKQESIDKIFELIRLKEAGHIRFLIVIGCLVQDFPGELREQLNEVDAFIGTGDYDQIPAWLEKTLQGRQVFHVGRPGYLPRAGDDRFALTPAYSRYLKISEGCSRRCSFCTIPLYRGPHRSRPIDEILSETRALVRQGAKEILLTGQDTTFFGIDREEKSKLPELLQRMNRIPDLRWIRLLYAYPTGVTDALIQTFRDCEKVCHYLDMPLQHASDKILKAMRRGTTRSAVTDLIGRFRAAVPDLAIRTTFIVGFPGETQKDYRDLLNFVRSMKFARVGVFEYSREEASPAAKFLRQVPLAVKRSRRNGLMRMQQKISLALHRTFVGRTLEVLIEQPAGKIRGGAVGRSYMDAPEIDGKVYVRSRKSLCVGRIYSVKITAARTYDLIGNA